MSLRFVFVHIPRTGGGTFGDVLGQLYPQGTIHRDRGYLRQPDDWVYKYLGRVSRTPDFDAMRNYSQFNVIAGHFPGSRYLALGIPHITFVRHPVDRMISQYYYLRQHRKLPQGTITDLYEYAESLPNYLSAYIGEIEEDLLWVGFTEVYDQSVKNFCQTFGFTVPSDYGRKNARKNREEHPNIDRTRIEKCNLWDIALYERLVKRFWPPGAS